MSGLLRKLGIVTFGTLMSLVPMKNAFGQNNINYNDSIAKYQLKIDNYEKSLEFFKDNPKVSGSIKKDIEKFKGLVESYKSLRAFYGIKEEEVQPKEIYKEKPEIPEKESEPTTVIPKPLEEEKDVKYKEAEKPEPVKEELDSNEIIDYKEIQYKKYLENSSEGVDKSSYPKSKNSGEIKESPKKTRILNATPGDTIDFNGWDFSVGSVSVLPHYQDFKDVFGSYFGAQIFGEKKFKNDWNIRIGYLFLGKKFEDELVRVNMNYNEFSALAIYKWEEINLGGGISFVKANLPGWYLESNYFGDKDWKKATPDVYSGVGWKITLEYLIQLNEKETLSLKPFGIYSKVIDDSDSDMDLGYTGLGFSLIF